LKRLSILLAVAAMLAAAACGDTSIETASTSTTRPAATTTNTTTSSTTATTTTVPATTTVVDQIAGVWTRVPHDETVFGGPDADTSGASLALLASGAFIPGPSGEVMDSVVAADSGLIAVGSDGSSGDWDLDAAVWTSPDGVTWSRAPHDEVVFGGDGVQVMRAVAASGPGLVAVGYDGPVGHVDVGVSADISDLDAAVWISPDGISWTRIPPDEVAFGGGSDQAMWSVVAGGPGLVAVGSDASGGNDDAAVWTSPDGVTWSRVPNDEEVFGGDGDQAMWSVAAGGPGLVAVGHDGPIGDWDAAVWTSPNGVSWTRVPHSETLFGGEDHQAMWSVVPGGPGLVAVGYDHSIGAGVAAVWTSPDGVTWTRVPHDEVVFGGDNWQAMWSLVAADSGLVAVGYDNSGGNTDAAVWTSPDGVTWSRVPHDEGVFGGSGWQMMNSVVAASAGLVAVGYDWSDGDWDAAAWTSADE
jgi:hypothetical protein